jgi:uncharacterized protein (TIGR01777 family)
MRVAITGGSGLIGRALAASLAADGMTPLVLSRQPSRVGDLPPGCEVAGWDGADPATLARVLEPVEAVVHLAGENLGRSRWTRSRKRRLRRSRVQSTSAVRRALEILCTRGGHQPSVLVQASAVGYYGPHGDEELGESSPPGTDFLAMLCQEWEAASAEVDSLGVRRVLIRSGVILDRRGGALPRLALPFRLFVGGPVGSGRQWVPWIHMSDEIGAIRFLLARPDARGAFNLVAPEPLRNRELAQLLGKVLGRPSFLPVPALALKLLLGEMSTVALDGQRAVPERLAELGYEFRFREPEAALRDALR